MINPCATPQATNVQFAPCQSPQSVMVVINVTAVMISVPLLPPSEMNT